MRDVIAEVVGEMQEHMGSVSGYQLAKWADRIKAALSSPPARALSEGEREALERVESDAKNIYREIRGDVRTIAAALRRLATPAVAVEGPAGLGGEEWKYERLEENEPASPDLWRIYRVNDPSYEATVCELWTGEQDNEAVAREICELHNRRLATPAPAVEVTDELIGALDRIMDGRVFGEYDALDARLRIRETLTAAALGARRG